MSGDLILGRPVVLSLGPDGTDPVAIGTLEGVNLTPAVVDHRGGVSTVAAWVVSVHLTVPTPLPQALVDAIDQQADAAGWTDEETAGA